MVSTMVNSNSDTHKLRLWNMSGNCKYDELAKDEWNRIKKQQELYLHRLMFTGYEQDYWVMLQGVDIPPFFAL